jgi:hypothetical protein
LHSFRGPYISPFSDGWTKFVETYAGSLVLGGTEELYLIRALQSTGKQKKQIRLDAATVGPFSAGWCPGLSRHGRNFALLPPWLGL